MTDPNHPDVQIRRADRADLPHLFELRVAWRGRDDTGQLAQRFTQWFDQEAATRSWWLALTDDTPVGMVNLKLFERMPAANALSSRWGHLGNLFGWHGFTDAHGLLALQLVEGVR